MAKSELIDCILIISLEEGKGRKKREEGKWRRERGGRIGKSGKGRGKRGRGEDRGKGWRD